MDKKSMYKMTIIIAGLVYVIAYFLLVNHVPNTGIFMIVSAAIYLVVSYLLKKNRS